VLVPVVGVASVPVAIVEVVDVVTVGDGLVPTSLTVGVVMGVVRSMGDLALVPVAVVLSMGVPVVQVVGVVVVADDGVSAALAVVVVMVDVGLVCGGAHESGPLGCVDDSVVRDVCDVVVSEGVGDLPAPPLAVHQAARTQHPEMLGHERLGQTECVDEVVHAAGFVPKEEHDRQPVLVAERAEQLGCGLERPARSASPTRTDASCCGPWHIVRLSHAHVCM